MKSEYIIGFYPALPQNIYKYGIGYDINFMKLSNFVLSVFIAGDSNTRALFMNKMLELLRQRDVPACVKTAWNDALQETIRA